jgi:hypothetical protein
MRGWRFILYLLIGAAAFIWLVKVPIFSNYLTDKLRLKVSIEWMSMWPSETTIRDLKIHNPEGFTSPFALQINKTYLGYHFKELLANPSLIELIECDSIILNIEFLKSRDQENNWMLIDGFMQNLPPSKPVLIRKLVLTNLNIEIRGQDSEGQVITHHVDRLEWNDVQGDDGFPVKQLIRNIFERVELEPVQ